MVMQYLYFDDLYSSYKQEKIDFEIIELSEMLEGNELTYADYISIENEFIFNDGTFLSIEDENGNSIKNMLIDKMNWYSVTGIVDDNTTIKFVTNDFELSNNYHFMISDDESSNHEDLSWFMVDSKYSIGYIDLIFDYKILLFLYDNNEQINFATDDELFKEGKILITSIKEASQSEINTYMQLSMYSNTGFGASVIFPISDSSFIETSGIFYTNINDVTTINGTDYTINAMVSSAPIGDATQALLYYFPYFLLFSVVCAFIVSFIYSRKVTKPIIQINNISKQMANFEFDKKIKIKSKNELSSVGDNLNFLASNLDTALSELKNANELLLEDIKQQKIQEKSRKDFVSNVSHELKTPLGAIRCYIESLKDRVLPEKQDEYYDDILKEVKKMTHLVMDMLELAKAESGDIKLNITKFDLEDMLLDNVTMFEFLAKDKNMNIILQGDFAPINADAQKMDSICSNIIDNAVKYGLHDSDVIITSSINNDICRVSMKNNCNYITQSDAEKLFIRFHTSDKSRNSDGTGLGLSICSAILNVHNFNYGIISHGEVLEIWFEYPLND